MTATAARLDTTPTRTARPALWRTGLAAGILAAAATEGLTAVLRASGVHLAAGSIGGTRANVATIGPGACAIMIAICLVVGLALAAGLERWATRPRRTWTIVTSALTVASFVPDIFAGATATSSKLSLMAAHVLAAAIVIPLVGRSLRTVR